jgi:hypothetical protein
LGKKNGEHRNEVLRFSASKLVAAKAEERPLIEHNARQNANARRSASVIVSLAQRGEGPLGRKSVTQKHDSALHHNFGRGCSGFHGRASGHITAVGTARTFFCRDTVRNFIAALRLAEQLRPGSTVVTVMRDTGMKYEQILGVCLVRLIG